MVALKTVAVLLALAVVAQAVRPESMLKERFRQQKGKQGQKMKRACLSSRAGGNDLDNWNPDQGTWTIPMAGSKDGNTAAARKNWPQQTGQYPGITVLNGDFDQVVLNSGNDVFFVLYDPNCGACLQARPHIYKLGELLQSASGVTIVMKNDDDNDVPTQYFTEQFVPVIKMFPKGSSPVRYTGEHNAADMARFIHGFCNCFDLNSVLQQLGSYTQTSEKMISPEIVEADTK